MYGVEMGSFFMAEDRKRRHPPSLKARRKFRSVTRSPLSRLMLLKLTNDAVLPAYLTPRTKVSAAFACLLDKSRTPVLEALLELDRDQVLNYKVPGSSLGYLGAHPASFETTSSFLDASDELTLCEASVYLGNFEAFRILNPPGMANDGMLHLAALMALPKSVTWLLPTHDAKHKAEEFDMMIPLAVVCESKPHSWCKVPNEELDWKSRQKETMRLLAPRTSPEWRYRGKTVLHIALENGLNATEGTVEALDILHDANRDEKYSYVDKDGIRYSPHEYVMKFLDVEYQEKNALIACLKNGGRQHSAGLTGHNPYRSSLGKDQAVALYTYDSKEEGYLCFKKGDIITITERTHNKLDWWTGRTKDGQVGLVPSNYIKSVT